ncbi:hypothetical protein HII36_46080 [Nonomuraea sp. NN258]|uniref:hypothetical protein n=1 Tax=Nonomuraea antri TaxID=2730852 RepID=UPI00156A35F4|nr:hypothetical protein [Nonomuraea antri]NRQ39145.1 hypothetical protein [Nonomuraea antri]
MVDEDRVPSPEETLRLIEAQRAATVLHLRGNPLLVHVPWGVAWLLGFTALFLHYGLDGRSYAPISQAQALTVLFSAQLVSGGLAALGIVRQAGHTRGGNAIKGAMYGWSWTAGLVVMTVLAVRLSPLLPEDEVGLLWAGGFMLVVGLLYMAGGAVWHDWPTFFLGTVTLAADAVGVMLGAGWHALLIAVLVGGGQIAIGLWLRRHP